MAIKFGTQDDDTISGGPGNDVLYGLDGDDTLYGRNGNDILHGGAGDDQIHGGRGIDTVVYSTAMDVEVNLLGSGYGWALDLGFDHLFSIENVITGSGNDIVSGDEGANLLSTGGGHDEVHGEEGDDVLLGGAGNDTLEGGTGDDVLRGGSGHDDLIGEQGDDVLEGNAGNDWLYGGAGADLMTGGTGADTFVVTPGGSGTKFGSRDIVTDFSQAEGDQFEFFGFDSMTFVGTDAFSGSNQCRYVQNGGKTFLQINTDLDDAPESVIELDGLINLTAADFVFVI
jgi:Ca2+-binding RTX toxin-like protein